MKKLFVSLVIAATCSSAMASEYCLDRFDGDIRTVNIELSDKLRRLSDLQAVLISVQAEKDLTSKAMVEIIKQDPALANPTNRERMAQLSRQFDTLDRRETEAKSESFLINDRVFQLKGNVPANLAGQLRGCVEAVKPANIFVNTVIQALAILSTGGASLALPPKTLYVDMGQVLNGYPLGGPQSVVNQTRESILNALGLGGNNTIGQIIKDPGRVIRCLFGC